MLLPDGWQGQPVSRESEESLLEAAQARLAKASRPDLLGTLRAYVRKSFDQLRRKGAFGVVMPGPDAPESGVIPASLILLERRGTAEASLDDLVRHAVIKYEARPLDRQAQIMRWRQERSETMDGTELGVTTLTYVIPIPGSRRTRALQLQATIGHPTEIDDDDFTLDAWVALFDTHVATFAWESQ